MNCEGAEDGCPLCSKNSKSTEVATGRGRGTRGGELRRRGKIPRDFTVHCKTFRFYEMGQPEENLEQGVT